VAVERSCRAIRSGTAFCFEFCAKHNAESLFRDAQPMANVLTRPVATSFGFNGALFADRRPHPICSTCVWITNCISQYYCVVSESGVPSWTTENRNCDWTDGFAEWEFAVREATRRSSLWVFGS
jgi:hypothetical protein